MPPTATYYIAETNTKTLLTQYLARVRREYALHSWKNQKYELVPFFDFLNIQSVKDLNLSVLDEAVAEFTKTWEESSISTFKQHLRSFFRWCVEYKEINLRFNPAAIKRKKYKPKAVRTFSKDEVKQVLAWCKEEQDRLIIALMFETGMRISEVINFQVEDITLTQIHVRGKGENDRVVHMSPELSRALREFRTARGRTSGFVFRPLQKAKNHPEAYYTSAYGVRDRIERAFLKAIGVKMHPHQLRHSFAVNWLVSGGDIRTLQIMLGHESIETTQWYLHLTDNQTGAIYFKIFSESVLT